MDDPSDMWSGSSLEHLSESVGKLSRTERLVVHYSSSASASSLTFDQLFQSPSRIAQVDKVYRTDAPKSAYPGHQQEGAIPWVHLGDAGSSIDLLDTVHRFETGGGKRPANCQGREGNFEVQYAAQYE